MDKANEKVIRKYDRAAPLYDLFEKPMEMMALEKWRQDIIKDLKGDVLEVGVGTGNNIKYYPDEADITAIDFSAKMLDIAKGKAKKFSKRVDLLKMDIQEMEFSDNRFDAIFATCVFCSVPDPIKGLKEIRRVCKPDGKIFLLEHVKSEKKLLGFIMNILNPLVFNISGANINRETIKSIYNSEYKNINVKNLFGDIVKVTSKNST